MPLFSYAPVLPTPTYAHSELHLWHLCLITCCLFIAHVNQKTAKPDFFSQGTPRQARELSSDTNPIFKQRNNLGPPGKYGFSWWHAVLHRQSVCTHVLEPRHFPWKWKNTPSACNPLVSNPTATVTQETDGWKPAISDDFCTLLEEFCLRLAGKVHYGTTHYINIWHRSNLKPRFLYRQYLPNF